MYYRHGELIGLYRVNYSDKTKLQYKIGENGEWTDYSVPFAIILTLSSNKLKGYNMNMKSKILIGFLSTVSILMLIITVFMYGSINTVLNADNRIINCEKYYILQTPEETYYQVCDENSMFDTDTVNRIGNFSSLEDNQNLPFCELNSDDNIISKMFLGIKNSDEEITVYENNKEPVIFSRYNCNQYFASKDFSLPEMSADNIEAVVISDSTDYKNIIEKYSDYSDIKNILENKKDFFEDINNKYSEAYDCYIIYKDFDLIEFISFE